MSVLITVLLTCLSLAPHTFPPALVDTDHTEQHSVVMISSLFTVALILSDTVCSSALATVSGDTVQ